MIIREDKWLKGGSLLYIYFPSMEGSFISLCKKWFEKEYRLTEQLRALGATSFHLERYFFLKERCNKHDGTLFLVELLGARHLHVYLDTQLTKITKLNIFL